MDNSKLSNNLNNNPLNLLIYELYHAHINTNELNIIYLQLNHFRRIFILR